MDEPMLAPSSNRFVLFPLQYPDIWDMYKAAQTTFWTAEDIHLASDLEQWESQMLESDRAFVSQILGILAVSDGFRNEMGVRRFATDIQVAEARCFYGFQAMIQNVHSEMYALLIDTYIRDRGHRRDLLKCIESLPSMVLKATWTRERVAEAETPLCDRLVAFAAVQGIFRASSFASVLWLKTRGLMPGLALCTERISRDESLHTDFACLILGPLHSRPSPDRIQFVVKEAVEVERLFVHEALPVDSIGLNAIWMGHYIEFVADRLLVRMGCDKVYNTPNPFDFVVIPALAGSRNFELSEYSRPKRVKENTQFTVDEDF
ncbi:ribonucleotide reductase small subunit [Mycena metata]|uniref:Ribonucleotide reductase small subunit n=1 Tax=Mycena metata TaxID=1033252 RepID=A0AAD7DV56_9AGAR|nr:ribonucleotide reductase small subunit [Mycena metata]